MSRVNTVSYFRFVCYLAVTIPKVFCLQIVNTNEPPHKKSLSTPLCFLPVFHRKKISCEFLFALLVADKTFVKCVCVVEGCIVQWLLSIPSPTPTILRTITDNLKKIYCLRQGDQNPIFWQNRIQISHVQYLNLSLNFQIAPHVKHKAWY